MRSLRCCWCVTIAGVASACTPEASLVESGNEPDAVVVDDAGMKGVGDAGVSVPDAGGFVDAGAAIPCIIEEDPLPFFCDGTEDRCDDQGDAVRPSSDILATWMTVELGSTFLTMRFAGIPFASGLTSDIGVWLALDDDVSNNQMSALFGLPNSDVAFALQWPVLGEQQTDTWMQLNPREQPTFLDPCGDISLSTDLHHLRIRFPSVHPSSLEALSYFVIGVSTGDAQFGSSEIVSHPDFIFIQPRGGPVPQLDFVSVCDLTCEELNSP